MVRRRERKDLVERFINCSTCRKKDRERKKKCQLILKSNQPNGLNN